MDPLIRPVRPEDALALYELRQQPLVQRFTTPLPSERLSQVEDRQEGWGPDDHVLVAELDGKVIGLAGLHVRDGKRRHSAWLGIAVHDAYHRRGVGTALMRALLDLADNWLGLLRVDLGADAENEHAIALYRRFGFVEEGRMRKAYFRQGHFAESVMMARIR